MTDRIKTALCISISALRGKGDAGTGDIGDLELLCDVAALLGIHKVIVNRVYDTAEGTPIYPVYIDLKSLGHLVNRGKEAEYLARAQELERLPEVDYTKVYNVKMHYLHEKFLQDGADMLGSDGYHEYWRTNRSWLEPYSVYCTLRHKYGTGNSRYWSEPDYTRLLNDAHFIKEYSGDLQFHCYVQYLLHCQLQNAVAGATEKGITLEIAADGTEAAPTLAQWWKDLNPDARQSIYNGRLGLPGEAPKQMEPWVAESELGLRLKENPAAVNLNDLLSVTSLATPAAGPSARMGITLESILDHKALLGQIRRILESPEK